MPVVSEGERKKGKRFWEIGAVVALLGALGATYPLGKAGWERFQQEQESRAYYLRQAKGGYYEDLHEFADEARSLGISRVPLASPADELCLAVSTGDMEQLGALLRGGADPNAPTTARWNTTRGDIEYAGVTPLWLAAGYGDLGAVKLLLAHGARAETADTTSWHQETALMRAAAAGSGPIVVRAAAAGSGPIAELLLRHGAALERRDAWGCTALWHAAHEGRAAALRVLIRHGARVDVPAGKLFGNDTGGPQTPLQWTAEDGHTEAARVLLEAGAARNPRAGGGTPLQLAEKSGHAETARVLRSFGCTR